MSIPSQIGPYRIIRQLGAGGMGTVYEGIQESIERRVAIKVLHPEYSKNPEVTARFFNEARAVNRIAHPGMVQISDYAQLPDGTAYLVMEFLKGESLASRLRRGPLHAASALVIAWQVADALSAAHGKEIVHRDLKPDNIMLVADTVAPGGERVKLLDFGIAKLAEEAEAGKVKTRTGVVMGTPRYMAPEQCKGAGQADDKADVYALGVMLFEMLAGKTPFDGEGHGEIIGKHIYEAPPQLRSLVTDLPVEVAALVHRLLVKDKNQRPAMLDVFEQLGELAAVYMQGGKGGRPSRPSGLIPIAPPNPVAAPNDSTLGNASGQSLLSNKWKSIRRSLAVVAALALGAGIGGFMVWRRPSPKPPFNVTSTSAEQAPDLGTTTVPRMVTWRIHSVPPGAEIVRMRDGKPLGKTPWKSQQPFASGVEELRLKLPGYADRDLSIDRSGHIELNERLDPAAPPPPSGATVQPAPIRKVKPKRPHPEHSHGPVEAIP